jgi:hypothetical protein
MLITRMRCVLLNFHGAIAVIPGLQEHQLIKSTLLGWQLCRPERHEPDNHLPTSAHPVLQQSDMWQDATHFNATHFNML